MIKIEIIHNTEILKILKSLMQTDDLFGFTSLSVTEGYGPLKGEYKEDHIGDEQYLTYVLLEQEEKANKFIQALKQRAPGNKFIVLKSVVEYLG